MKLPLFKTILFLLVFVYFGQADSLKIRLQWKHQFEFAGFYAALEKGFYREAGLDVTLLEYDEEVDSLEELLEGDVEFTTLYGNAILERQEGTPIILVANYLKRSPLVLAVKPEILTPKDLKGKTIMASEEEMNSPHFRQLFKRYGITEKDYTLYPVSFSVDEFVEKKVDAISVFLPNELFWLWEKNIPFGVLDPAHYGTVMLYDVNLVTSESYARTHPAQVKAFKEASDRGWQYALAHKEEIVDLILAKYNTQNKSRKHLLFEADEIEKLMEPKAYPIGSIDHDRIVQIEKLYMELDDTNNFVDPASFIFQHSDGNSIMLTEKEKHFIQTHPEIVFGIDGLWVPFIIPTDSGGWTGYEVEFLNKVKALSGLNITIKTGKWGDMVKQAQNKEIDGLMAAAFNEERKKDFLFTTPYNPMHYLVAVKAGNPHKIQTVDDLKTITFAVQKDNLQHIKMVAKVSQKKPILTETHADAFEAIKRGEAQATIALETLSYELQRKMVTGIQPLLRLEYTIDLLYSTRNDWPELKSILDKAIKAIPYEEKSAMKSKWFLSDIDGTPYEWMLSEQKKNSQRIKLSEEERYFLQQHGSITLCVDPLWRPIDYIEEGEHRGVGADFVKLFSERIGREIQLYPVNNWAEVLEAAKSRQCDMVSLMSETSERNQYLSFTDPYFSSQNVIVTRNEVSYVEDMSKVQDELFGVIRGFAARDLLRKKYPGIKLLEVDSVEDGLRKVEAGEIFGFIDIIPTIVWHIQRLGMVGLKISGHTGIPLHLAMGVRNDSPELVSIMQKAVASLSKTEKEDILNRVINIRYEEHFDYELLWKVAAVFLVLLSGVVYWSRRLDRLNRALHDAKEEAEQANYAKTLFLANMSHELRTPLNAIIGFAQLLRQDEANQKERRRNLEIIQRNGVHLLALIDDILDMSRIETNNLEWHVEPVDIGQLANDLLAVFQPRAAQRGLELCSKISLNGQPVVLSDRRKLHQILSNLLSNAIKYTDLGEIVLQIEYRPTKKDELMLLMSVSDTGRGIPDDQIEWVFSPFSQSAASASREGVGLGLAITQKLVQHLNGNIKVDSQVGEGSCFSVTIPVQKAESDSIEAESQPMTEPPAVASAGVVFRMLIVEDNEESRELLSGYLRQQGHIVQEVPDGEQALMAVADFQPDMVWMDLMMPGMDGCQASEQIRKMEHIQQPAIIVISAAIERTSEEMLMAQKIDGVVHKPYLMQEIEAQIIQYAYKHSARSRDALHSALAPEAVQLLEQIASAAQVGDTDRIHRFLEEEAVRNIASYTVLKNLADSFDYAQLIVMIQQIQQSESPESSHKE